MSFVESGIVSKDTKMLRGQFQHLASALCYTTHGHHHVLAKAVHNS